MLILLSHMSPQPRLFFRTVIGQEGRGTIQKVRPVAARLCARLCTSMCTSMCRRAGLKTSSGTTLSLASLCLPNSSRLSPQPRSSLSCSICYTISSDFSCIHRGLRLGPLTGIGDFSLLVLPIPYDTLGHHGRKKSARIS